MIGKRNLFEKPKEYIATTEEVHAVLRELIKGEYEVVKYREDENGIYYLEVTAPGEADGDVNEYIYTRQGTFPECLSTVSDINVIYYSDGMPVSGDTVAKYRDGTWQII